MPGMPMIARLLGCAAVVSLVIGSTAAVAAPAEDMRAREAAFDASISSADQIAWLKDFASAPNHVGSPHIKETAEKTAALFKSWGWNARIEVFQTLYPTPISTTLEMITPEKVTLGGQEPAIAGDETSARLTGALPPYVAFQGDGDVTAQIVYVNYGMPADYDDLARRGIDVKGKIMLARYGGGWRGLKPKLAQEHGAAGCLIYSDPADDGYADEDTYPKGGGRPSTGVQRGSVLDMTTYPGDPLTPGVGSTPDARRLTRATAETILKIPTLPISYGDATRLLANLEGPMVSEKMHGGLPLTYHYGGTAAVTAHLAVKSEWSQKPLYDVIATIPGKTRPDEWVVRGNHRDGWVFGAADPLSGHGAMLSEAKAIGALLKTGWRPDRTIVYASWDGEEPGLLGSTEWAEAHADELKKKAVVYVNTDGNGRGFLGIEGSHDLQRFALGAADEVIDPETGVTVNRRARAAVLARDYDAPGSQRPETLAAAKAASDLPIGPLGSGSDYTAFLHHLGIPSINVGFGGESSNGAYHSVYDSYDRYVKFVDPGLKYGAVLSKVIGRMVLRASTASRVPARYSDFATTVSRYLGEVKQLAADRRDRDRRLASITADGGFRLTADPQSPMAAPEDKGVTPLIDMLALEDAADRLTKSARAADSVLGRFDMMDASHQAAVAAPLKDIDQTLLDADGLPFRPWFRNMIYAPGRFTGYGAKTLPGVREAIEERRFADAAKYVAKTAKVLNLYADRLDAAVAAAK